MSKQRKKVRVFAIPFVSTCFARWYPWIHAGFLSICLRMAALREYSFFYSYLVLIFYQVEGINFFLEIE